MKINYYLFKGFLNYVFIVLFIIPLAGCGRNKTGNVNAQNEIDTLASVPDTGFTGIRQYYSKEKLVKEVTFQNGIRHGLMKTFYEDGKLRQTFTYKNGTIEDTARWYYLDGLVFRETLYKNDTMDGDQIQYYRTGKVKAKMSYIKGVRTPDLVEYLENGKLVTTYPELIFKVKDEYNSNGLYKINLELSERTIKVKFYRGEFTNGVFDTLKVKEIPVKSGIGYLELKKSNETNDGKVGVIASFLTGFGNRKFIYKSIDLPYNNLK
jgi:antitoxin component YwqK of YwqJK toxin-antitoxin module